MGGYVFAYMKRVVRAGGAMAGFVKGAAAQMQRDKASKSKEKDEL